MIVTREKNIKKD